MISTINEFVEAWTEESEATIKIFQALTDKALDQKINPEGRTLARLAWHITQTIGEMCGRMGLKLNCPEYDIEGPANAEKIVNEYTRAAHSLLDEIKTKWQDDTLQIKDNMYGEEWKRSQSLTALISHQIHHRGQMTVLMRQAGLKVPGIYGPAREEWSVYGMQAPKI